MRTFTLLFTAALFNFSAVAQLNQPINSGTGDAPIHSGFKAPGDSCGAYFNDYVGLHKTSGLGLEEMRTGDGTDFNPYAGRAQRFHAPQPIIVSGVRFYAYHEAIADSVQITTYLWDYDAGADSVGAILATGTGYVTETAYTPVLPYVEVNSFFDSPVTVTADYMVGMVSDHDSLVFIYRNTSPEGAGEGVSYVYYDNPAAPSFTGWYNSLATFGAGYDVDYLIAPRVEYDLHESFVMEDDSVCQDLPGAACANYVALEVFNSEHYNSNFASVSDPLQYLWGDGNQNTGLSYACHMYDAPGDYTITLVDTLFLYSVTTPYCVVNTTQNVHVWDVPIPDFTYTGAGFTLDFTNTSSEYDSVWWDFGDMSAGTDLENPSHTYPALGSYDVVLHAFNECEEDSTTITVEVTDVGIEINEFDLSIFPNPAKAHINIAGLIPGAELSLVNMLGQTVYSIKTTGPTEKIDVSLLSAGPYFIKAVSGKTQMTKKVIVQH